MLNMIKMDVYRMFRTKSMYVIWIILLASALLTSFLSKIDYDAVNKEWERQQAVESQADTDGQTVDVVNAQDIEEQQADNSNKEQLSQQNTDNVNVGMSVELPTEPGKKVTVMDVFFSNAQGKFYAHLNASIFAAAWNTNIPAKVIAVNKASATALETISIPLCDTCPPIFLI